MMSIAQRNKSGRRWSVSADDLPCPRQEKSVEQALPEELGSGRSKTFQLDADMSYIETRYMPATDLAILSRMDYQQPRLVVTLGLQGTSRFIDTQGKEVLFDAGYTTITAFSSSSGERHYEAGQAVTQLRFSVSQHWLHRYFGSEVCKAVFSRTEVESLAFQPIAPHALIAAQQLIADPSEQPLLIHAQALSILAAELQILHGAKRGETASIKRRDEAIAQAAHAILKREFKNPPSVAELSRRSGTNPFKLKQLFHRFYNTTPYGLLLDIRMQTAYRLLQSSDCQVSAAAEYVGYSHASNFSAAFTKYFGVPPKRI